jgi:hypothetical protein
MDSVSVVFAATRHAITDNLYGMAFGRSEEADKRSVELLKAWLSPDQLERFNQDGKFAVVGSKSRNKYWITDGRQSHNVVRIDLKTNRSAERLCFVPENASAKGDVMLAQKIMLETNEPHALKIANRYAVTAEA